MKDQQSKLHQVVFELTKSLSGHTDIKSICSALMRSLRQAIDFDGLALFLMNPRTNCLHGYIEFSGTNKPGNYETFDFWEETPAGLVLREQKLLIIPDIEIETRWSSFLKQTLEAGIHSLGFFPLIDDAQCFGVLILGKHIVFDPSPIESEYLERIVSELAVRMKVFVIQEQLKQERDHLLAIHEISNSLTSKLSIEELFPIISEQLQKLVIHEMAAIALQDQEKKEIHHYALHCPDMMGMSVDIFPISTQDPFFESILIEGKAVSLPIDRLDLPLIKQFHQAGFSHGCAVPLVTPNGIIGLLALSRRQGQDFGLEEIDLLTQVAAPIAVAIDNSLAYRQLRKLKDQLASEKLYLEDEIRLDKNFGNMLGESPAFRTVQHSIQIVAPTDSTVLILGETGTGKELVARAIHEAGKRRPRTFVKLNCAAIPSGLLESELFGHEKGAFTGAIASKMGRFELANQGTLFLDEIGEIPLELQSKLLRAIQEQELERLGSNRTIRVDVRIIAATNRNLKAMVEENKFRSDLYYRLHVFPLYVPPLRERKEDIPLLVRFFTQKFAQRMNRAIDSISSETIRALTGYHWPGNIRELQNIIERSVILTTGRELKVPLHEIRETHDVPIMVLTGRATLVQRDQILQALEECRGVVGGLQGAAARLGMKRTTLQSYMKRLGIRRCFRPIDPA